MVEEEKEKEERGSGERNKGAECIMMLTGKTTSVIILIPPSFPILMFYLLTSVEGNRREKKDEKCGEDEKGILSMELLPNVTSERMKNKNEWRERRNKMVISLKEWQCFVREEKEWTFGCNCNFVPLPIL